MENYLIYINEIGKNYKKEFVYEFLFSNTIENIDGEDWDEYPAGGKPQPPDISLIYTVGKLTSDIKLDVIQNSDTFSVWDAVDGVVSMAWENIDEYDEYPEKRLCFKFGETLNDVKDKLYGIDIKLETTKLSDDERNVN